MPLVYSPTSEEILNRAPRKLLPRHAFLMRQLGSPSKMDQEMTQIVKKTFGKRGIKSIDAGDTAGQNDFLQRILGLIRSTAFTVAIFSEETRPESLANITLELGFAAMCGKPLVIVKSKGAKPPSDLTRTDWIVYDEADPSEFRKKLGQAIDEILELVPYEEVQLGVALNAGMIDCATALEKASKAFLLSGDGKFIDMARQIFGRLDGAPSISDISDLLRIREEADTFIRQADAAVALSSSRKKGKKHGAVIPGDSGDPPSGVVVPTIASDK